MQAWNMRMEESSFRQWMMTASAEEKKLRDRIYELSEFFDDMLFEPGSSTGEILTCQMENQDGEWENSTCIRAPELEFFSYNFFVFQVESMKYPGAFDQNNQILYIAPEYLDDDVVILHEMIHLHEFVVNSTPMYYHDALIWGLYANLKHKIKDIDKMINRHIHLLNEQSIHHRGGVHDLLFLLKSIDLDIKRGYPFGTVFGYGTIDDFKQFT